VVDRARQQLGTFAGSLYQDVQSPAGLCAGKFAAVTAVGIGCIKKQAGQRANLIFFALSPLAATRRRMAAERALILSAR